MSDHECEDGDKISVDVEGRTVFSGEIVNDWDCETIEVRGRENYVVELTALNGTGYKGNCSYIDENTGEIRSVHSVKFHNYITCARERRFTSERKTHK